MAKPYFRIHKVRDIDKGIEFVVYTPVWTKVKVLWILPLYKRLWIAQGHWPTYEEAKLQVLSMADRRAVIERTEFRKDGTEIIHGGHI